MSLWIGSYSLVKGLKNQGIVVGVTDEERHDSPVVEIQNGTEVEFVLLGSDVVLELCHVSQPFFVWFVCIKLTPQNICRQILRVGSLSCTAMVAVLNGRFDPFSPANAQYPLVAYRCLVEPLQIIPYPPVSLVWLLIMNLLYQIPNTLILCGSLASVAGLPLVIRRPGHPQNPASCIDGIVKFFVAIPDCTVLAFLPYLPQRSLLSNSFTFFSRSRSIFSI